MSAENPFKNPKTKAELVAWFGHELFGVEWGSDMARLTDTSQRTVARIKAAAHQHQEYPAARGVLSGLRDALEHYADQAATLIPEDD